MAKHWWKVLAVLLWIYVLIAGFLVPLKPGVHSVSPTLIKSGNTLDLQVHGYNSHYSGGDNSLIAILKIDSLHCIESSSISVANENNLSAIFNIPSGKVNEESLTNATLILSNQTDGSSIYPDAITIDQRSAIGESKSDLMAIPYDRFSSKDAFNFPYRNIWHETVRNLFFHVSLWFSMIILLLVALYHSIRVLRSYNFESDLKAAAYTKVAILFGLLGLATGSIWAKYTWGTFWTTDVKLNMSAIAMLIYLAYLILRSSIQDEDKRAKVSAAFNIFAFVALIPLIFVIPRLTSSLHPGNGGNPALGGEDMDNTLRMIFYPAIIGFTLLGIWLSQLKYRFDIVHKKWLLRG